MSVKKEESTSSVDAVINKKSSDTDSSNSSVKEEISEYKDAVLKDEKEKVVTKKVKHELELQIFTHLEDKTGEALSHFTELKDCTYGNKSIGVSGQEETMTCDCHEHWDPELGKNMACGEDSDCINRITSVECVDDHCTCGNQCQNQRFQRKEYAPVSVIQTEKKGYGLRADKDILPGTFIYEYIGEVIDEAHFRKRMVVYDQKKLKHFYFMMLQKGEFIDATMKGCLARFCNHSCNPNAYVDKWVVGKKLKMGIFSKRKITKGEEVTFDYNVDRYGADAQPCYCGESNCIGFLGGKTQTDSALILPDGISEALGVTHDQEKEWLQFHKKTKTKTKNQESNVNEDFINSLKVLPLSEHDVSKVMSSLMRSQELCITKKLIERIRLTTDPNLQTRVIRIHGYQTLSVILKDTNLFDNDLIVQILEVLLKWPKITKNKISSSKIEDVIKELSANSDDEKVKSLSEELLTAWSALEMAYRIPKKNPKEKSASPESQSDYLTSRSAERKSESSNSTGSGNGSGKVFNGETLPEGWEWAADPTTNDPYFFHRDSGLTQWEKPAIKALPTGPKNLKPISRDTNHIGYEENHHNRYRDAQEYQIKEEQQRREKEREKELLKREKEKKSIEQIIKRAHEVAEKKRLEEENLKKEQERLFQEKHSFKKLKSSSKEPSVLSAQWTKALAAHVPNAIKKHEPEVGRDTIKQCAKDIVKMLAEKELKRHKEVPPKELGESKIKKIKEFSSGYMDKFLIKFRGKVKRKVDQSISPDSKRIKTIND